LKIIADLAGFFSSKTALVSFEFWASPFASKGALFAIAWKKRGNLSCLLFPLNSTVMYHKNHAKESLQWLQATLFV